MYQRNLVRNSLSESIVSNQSVEKHQPQQSHTRADSAGNHSSSSGRSMSENGSSRRGRESVKMDYSNMETYQDMPNHRHHDHEDEHNNDASADDGVSDVDSIEDLQGNGRRVTTTQVQIHTKSSTDLEFEDDEVVLESEIPKDPVVTAYLEQASHICQNNCVKSMTQFNTRNVQDEEGIYVEDSQEDAIVPNGGGGGNLLLPVSGGSVKNRRTSLSSGSVGRMETIVEEPIEAKVSVKEILARFETLRESAEVNALRGLSTLSWLGIWREVGRVV